MESMQKVGGVMTRLIKALISGIVYIGELWSLPALLTISTDNPVTKSLISVEKVEFN
jgi:hypothetical protein